MEFRLQSHGYKQEYETNNLVTFWKGSIINISVVLILLLLYYRILTLIVSQHLCFIFSVMDADFDVWKDGIPREDFHRARELGVHYQIINHQLFREKPCMFPAR